jgi:hypothetical protein
MQEAKHRPLLDAMQMMPPAAHRRGRRSDGSADAKL